MKMSELSLIIDARVYDFAAYIVADKSD